ncbi:hypothetical protein CHARACLAT_029097 [Characodon lateralis]|uniref:Uncharacterized protein n=1 Tax=Characodon lateralis TaxID=208331 RepID=A0ABU7DKQ4_9TELE|nr:hypothetical protein [Characodon lateralis]
MSSPAHYLSMVGVSARWCTCGSQCLGLGALVCAGSLLVAASWGLDPGALSGLCLGSDMSQGLGSLGSWQDLLGRSWAVGWFPRNSPLLFFGGVAIVPVIILLGFLCSGGPLDVYGSDLLHICPRSSGAGLWLLTLTIAYFYGKTL